MPPKIYARLSMYSPTVFHLNESVTATSAMTLRLIYSFESLANAYYLIPLLVGTCIC